MAASVPARERILAWVRARPGTHLREVAREAGVPLATTLYHLDRLEAEGMLRSAREHRARRFFDARDPARAGVPTHAQAPLLRRAMARRLVLAVATREGATQADLRRATGASRGGLSSQLANLVRHGALVERPGRVKSYAVASADVLRDALRASGSP